MTWTASAAAQLADRQYRYLSPTFYYSRSGGGVSLIQRAGLTNSPKFQMPALAAVGAAGKTNEIDTLAGALKAASKLSPALEGWFKEYAAADLPGAKAWAAANARRRFQRGIGGNRRRSSVLKWCARREGAIFQKYQAKTMTCSIGI